MTEIGRLKSNTPDNLSRLSGQIQTFDNQYAVRLDGDESFCDAKKPSHRIFARNRNGADIQIGSAWLKTATRGPNAGDRFFTLTIDYPGLASALNAAAFLDPDGDGWVVVWRRRVGQAEPRTLI
jgi:uncharacterized protein (DUF736 family)